MSFQNEIQLLNQEKKSVLPFVCVIRRMKQPFRVKQLFHVFLGPRGPLIEPLSVHPSRPPATIFPEFIDELKHCRQASGTPQIVYFLKAHDVSYPNSDKIQIQTQIQRQLQRQKQIKGLPMQ